MNQTTRTLVALGVVVVLAGALGLYAWQGVYQADRVETEKKDTEARLIPPGPAGTDAGADRVELTRLTITADGQTTVLEREPGQPWRITSPVKARADAVAVDAIVSQLQTARFKTTLEETPDAETLARYGLDAPRFTVEAQGTGTTVKLEGGIENPFDGSVYMRRGGDPKVYVAEGGVRYTMAKPTFELRDKQPLQVDEKALTSIEVRSAANRWTLERQDGGSWAFTRPVSEPADGVQISSMVGAMATERALAFPEATTELLARFTAPALDATLGTTDGGLIHLRMVPLTPDGGTGWLALREDPEGQVLAELSSSAPQLDRNLVDLKDKSVVRFDKDRVTRVEMSGDAGTVIVEKVRTDAGTEDWQVVAPREVKAKGFKVASTLWALAGLRASTWGEEKPRSWSRFGVGEASPAVVVKGADGAELGRLTVGAPVPSKAGMVYARGTRDQVAEIDATRLDELFYPVEDVADEPPPPALDGGSGADGGS